jgi:hypothetical protein
MTMSERPAWLAQEPEVLALLHAVLDRFDQQPGDTRHKAILVPAQKHLASLAANDVAADRSWALLLELQRRGALTIRRAKRNQYDAEWHSAKLAFAPESEELLRAWLERAPAERAMQVWRRAVNAQAQAFPGGCDALLSRRIVLSGRTGEEIVAALARIGKVQRPATLRQLSAFAFWGDSKVLDDRADLIAALFPRLEVRERSIVVAVYLPSTPIGVVFIENQDTYTAATTGVPAALQQHALVYASGFRSSASRIRSRSGALLHYAGSGEARLKLEFEQWWFEDGEPCGPRYFWGDLDFAGMQILKTLRSRFGDIGAWQPGYEPMLAALRTHGGHHGHGETASTQLDPQSTGCSFADAVLLPAIREHGQIDQERLEQG